MGPERTAKIGSHVIEEFYWNGRYSVYIDSNKAVDTFGEVCDVVREALDCEHETSNQ